MALGSQFPLPGNSWCLSDNERWIKAIFAYYFRIFRRKLLLGDISIFQDKKYNLRKTEAYLCNHIDSRAISYLNYTWE